MQKAFEEMASNMHLDNGQSFSLDNPMISNSKLIRTMFFDQLNQTANESATATKLLDP